MNDLSTVFPSDPEAAAIDNAAPPEAPMAMPTQTLEARKGRFVDGLVAALRPARQPSRGV
ncbi:MAG: hypothetical protein ACU0B7_12820 [Paracoccaceae bacterium]|uniref:hypothetical protein n=1 Tax=Seohaeicola saemankumensis TaxID=481181 RepID=UPI001E522AE2|nr:hypothetical protein [Seohaeicola saemankumensis]MCD1625384.1 hypothetical protein [Seohaeicola saemankumensis]